MTWCAKVDSWRSLLALAGLLMAIIAPVVSLLLAGLWFRYGPQATTWAVGQLPFEEIMGGLDRLDGNLDTLRSDLKRVEDNQTQIGRQVSTLEAHVLTMRDEMDDLALPDQVFRLLDGENGTRPLLRYCEDDVPCRWRISVARYPDALPCEIVPGSATWRYHNPPDQRHDSPARARRLHAPQHRGRAGDHLSDVCAGAGAGARR